MERSRRDLLLETLKQLEEEEFKVKLADIGQKGGYNPIPWGQLERAKPAEVAAELINHYGVRCGLETAGEVLWAIKRGELAGGLAEALETYEERCREQRLALCGVQEMQARTVGSLGEEDLRRIRERAAKTHPQGGPYGQPLGRHLRRRPCCIGAGGGSLSPGNPSPRAMADCGAGIRLVRSPFCQPHWQGLRPGKQPPAEHLPTATRVPSSKPP
uniref:Pyrin domain-containing protein n=1 Tax=Chrysemys picta bellii TaxID=8478 RepID=A0A8C3HHI3_CHRPI